MNVITLLLPLRTRPQLNSDSFSQMRDVKNWLNNLLQNLKLKCSEKKLNDCDWREAEMAGVQGENSNRSNVLTGVVDM